MLEIVYACVSGRIYTIARNLIASYMAKYSYIIMLVMNKSQVLIYACRISGIACGSSLCSYYHYTMYIAI